MLALRLRSLQQRDSIKVNGGTVVVVENTQATVQCIRRKREREREKITAGWWQWGPENGVLWTLLLHFAIVDAVGILCRILYMYTHFNTMHAMPVVFFLWGEGRVVKIGNGTTNPPSVYMCEYIRMLCAKMLCAFDGNVCEIDSMNACLSAQNSQVGVVGLAGLLVCIANVCVHTDHGLYIFAQFLLLFFFFYCFIQQRKQPIFICRTRNEMGGIAIEYIISKCILIQTHTYGTCVGIIMLGYARDKHCHRNTPLHPPCAVATINLYTRECALCCWISCFCSRRSRKTWWRHLQTDEFKEKQNRQTIPSLSTWIFYRVYLILFAPLLVVCCYMLQCTQSHR